MPVCELKQAFGVDCDLYNRSLPELTVSEASVVIDDCVSGLLPGKALINLGETDLEYGCPIPNIICEYEKLIEKIRRSSKRCKLVIVSVCEDGKGELLNRELEKMADRMKCQYADISPAAEAETPEVKAFGLLKFFILDRISISDIMFAGI